MGEAATVECLPDFPAIEQLNKALWRAGRTRGAAVLVGAGFSRNAERIHEGVPMPPDWKALTMALQTRLGYSADEHKEPLRIAEEFIASLGRTALDSLVMELIPDDQWLPGSAAQGTRGTGLGGHTGPLGCEASSRRLPGSPRVPKAHISHPSSGASWSTEARSGLSSRSLIRSWSSRGTCSQSASQTRTSVRITSNAPEPGYVVALQIQDAPA
jgi:hypothetical protein